MPKTQWLYHFLRKDHALQAIEKSQLKISDLDKTNDPYEFLTIAFPNRELEEGLLKFQKTLATNYGVVCFSETYDNPALWGHYADKFMGICLGYEFTRTDKFRKVSYEPRRLPIEQFSDLIKFLQRNVKSRRLVERYNHNSYERAREQLLDLMHTKSCNWEYEREWRAWSRKEISENEMYFAELNKCELREILIGFRSPKQSKIKSQIRKLIAKYPDPPPKIFLTQRSLSTYKIKKVAT